METLVFIRMHLLAWPILAKAAVALALIVGVPPLSQRIGIPGVVGLLLTGVLVGPQGLELIGRNHPIADFFADFGRLLLMFFAGLEIDLSLVRKARTKLYVFGVLTTTVPLILGTAVGLLFGYAIVPAIVVGSLLSSHTLLGLRVISRLGEIRSEAMIVTIGATLVSDTLSLLVFSICASVFRAGFSARALGLQLLEIAVFVPFILVGLSRLGAWLLKKVANDENAYFLVMLAILALAGVVAKAINLPGIVGAFLAGLAVNAAVQHKSAKEKLEFFGNSLFIPFFFVVTGFLISPVHFLATIASKLPLTLSIVLAVFLGKAIAVEIAGDVFSYSRIVRKTMWSLTLPQVAATLAASLAAYETTDPNGVRLLNSTMLDVVIVVMLITSILGLMFTERFAPQMVVGTSPSTFSAYDRN
jgi:Kef-type K+ transport system membrane component KefB